jgi:hypothetical protein
LIKKKKKNKKKKKIEMNEKCYITGDCSLLNRFTMGGNSVEGEGSSTILQIRGEVAEDGDGLALKMTKRINRVKLLKPAVDDNHCIFRLPESFNNMHQKNFLLFLSSYLIFFSKIEKYDI